MKILHLISSAGHYGAENMLLELTSALKRSGCDLIIGVFENEHRPSLEIYKQATQRGLDAQLIRCSGRIDRNAVRQISSLIRENEIDVLHSHGYKSNIYGYWAALGTGIPAVATCHGWPGTSLALQVYYFLDKLLLRQFDRVVPVSDVIARSLKWVAIPNRLISRIPNGIDQLRFQDSLRGNGSAPAHPPGKRVGVVARLSPEKGIRFLLTASKEVLREFSDTKFCLIGDGPERSSLESLAREVGVLESVEFWGFRTDMPNVYAQLDIFVLPSLSEGLPMAILEAMSAVKPVVATRVGALPDVVISDRTGLLVEPADSAALSGAILQYLRNADLASKLAKNGAEHVAREYSAAGMAQKYMTIYREALNRRKTGTAQAHQAV